MMTGTLENGALKVRSTAYGNGNGLDASLHACSRELVVTGRYNQLPAEEGRNRDPYVSLTLEARELSFEVPEGSVAGPASEVQLYLSLYQARSLRAELDRVLEYM